MSLKPSMAAATFCACLLLLPSCDGGDDPGPILDDPTGGPSASFDFEAIAHTLVTRSADIREGHLVLIHGSPRDLELLENLAVNVRRLGAHPLITLTSDRLDRRMWDDVPEELDDLRWEWGWKLSEVADASISIASGEDPALLDHIPPERFAARAQANQELPAVWRERGVRLVDVGNNLYPTVARAEQLGLERRELERLFWEGVTADPQQLAATGGRLRAILEAASTVQVTHPNGTDFTVGVVGARVTVSDGRATPQEGGDVQQVWLPAGEVFLTVEPGTAEGRLVVDRFPFGGDVIEGLDLVFSGGRLQSMDASSDFTRLREFYETGPPERDRLSVIGFGINPGITSHRILSYMTAGMFTAFMGADDWAGGDVAIPFSLDFHLPGTTIRVDDQVVVEDGVLRL